MYPMPLIVLLTLLALLIPTAVPATTQSNAKLLEQRVLFQQVMASAYSGTLSANDPRLRTLRDYPLYKYIEAAELRQQLRDNPNKLLDERIAAFIDNNPDLPPAQRLRGPWLKTLGKRHRWSQVIAHTHSGDSTTSRCRAVHARIALGQHPEKKALALWRVGRSQPKTCDAVFAWLQQQGLLTADEIMRRTRLSLLSSQYGMVRYLAKKLPAEKNADVQRWLKAAQSTKALEHSGKLPDDVLVYAFKRAALRNWDDAAAIYPSLVKRQKPGAGVRDQMQRYVALLFAQDQEPDKALKWFARLDDKHMDAHARAWQVRAAVWQRRWPAVIKAIHAMSQSQASEEEWRYWLGRALLKTHRDTKANEILGKLATQRSYFGYLAADLLGRSYQFNNRELPPAPKARKHILALPALARARELDTLGRDWQFRREWRQVVSGLDKTQLREAARIAFQRGWYSQAIITLARGDYWDALNIRYPMPYLDSVRSSATDNKLSPAYVLAIIRTESLFEPSAVSAAGAIGLMQLMPGTARLVARHNSLAKPTRSTLRQPVTNIRLGSGYLHKMKKKFDGNLALATAAYNAGPNAVKRWLPLDHSVPAAIWIANISYTETRHYVQRVMAHMTVFEHRLTGQATTLDARLPDVLSSYGG